MNTAIAILVFLLLLPSVVLAQSTVFVVRHAERADAAAPVAGGDPELSDVGRARAESLAAMLKDARITQIYVTEFKRTRQTGEPLAKRLGLEPTVVSSKSTPTVAERVQKTPGNALVVGHSNTVPDVLKALGVEEAVAVADAEYDNLFIVTLGAPPSSATPSLVRLRYR